MQGPRPSTVAELLNSSLLRDASVIGGAAGINRNVSDVTVRQHVHADRPLEPGTLVVMDAALVGDDTYRLDRALRSVARDDGSAIVLVGASELGDTGPARVANQFQIPLILMGCGAAAELAFQLRAAYWTPDVEAAATTSELLRKLGGRRITDRDVVLQIASAELGVGLSLLDRNRIVVAGEQIEIGNRRLAEATGHHVDHGGPNALHSAPIILEPGGPPAYWLVAATMGPAASAARISTGVQLTAWYLAATLALKRVEAERDARIRIAALNAILDAPEFSEDELPTPFDALRWSVRGWNTAIHLRADEANQSVDLYDEMAMRLRHAGMNIALVERGDGWSGWINESREPSSSEYGQVVAVLNQVTRAFVSAHPTATLYGGVGRPGLGITGVRTSLAEAHEASLLARAQAKGPAGVVHIDHLGIQRVLLGWFGSEEFRRFGRSMLEPLIVNDRNGELLATLEVYLDTGASATAAAASLGLHRNTINNRVQRVRELLNVDLTDPEVRLSLQLATRVARLD